MELLLALALLAVEPVTTPPTSTRSLISHDEPAQCPFAAEHYFYPDRPREIRLRPKSPGDTPVLLATHVRAAELVFSHDCSAIALNDHEGSDLAVVRLFQRKDDLAYQALPFDFASAAWTALAKSAGLAEPPHLWHTSVAAVDWSSDSLALLLRVWGHSDASNYVAAWFCVFDLRAHSVSTDLSTINRYAIVLGGRSR